MTSIYNIVGTADLIIGILGAILSLLTANWAGLLLSLAILAHGAAWERLEEDLERISNR